MGGNNRLVAMWPFKDTVTRQLVERERGNKDEMYLINLLLLYWISSWFLKCRFRKVLIVNSWFIKSKKVVGQNIHGFYWHLAKVCCFKVSWPFIRPALWCFPITNCLQNTTLPVWGISAFHNIQRLLIPEICWLKFQMSRDDSFILQKEPN